MIKMILKRNKSIFIYELVFQIFSGDPAQKEYVNLSSYFKGPDPAMWNTTISFKHHKRGTAGFSEIPLK